MIADKTLSLLVCAGVALPFAAGAWARTAEPSVEGPVRIVRIKAVADESFRRSRKWEREIQEHIEWADKEMRKIAGVGLELVATEPWSTHESAVLSLLLHELRVGVEKGQAEVVIGFTGHEPPESIVYYEGEVFRFPLPFTAGMAFPLGDRAVVRRSEWKEQTRYTIIHEIAHLFGGLHVDEKSVLETYTDRTAFVLDPYNKRIFELTIDRDFRQDIRDLSREELAELVDLYRESPLRNANEPDTAIRVAYLYLAYGAVDLAVREFRNALEIAPQSSREALYYAIIPELEEAYLAKHEPTIASRYMLGQAYFVVEELEKAYQQLAPNCAGAQWDAPSCSLLGAVFFRSKNLRDAERFLMRALQLDDSLPDAYNNLASLYFAGGMVEKALENYGRAQELDPTNPAIHFNTGLTYLFAEKPGPAEASFREVLRLRDGQVTDSVKLALALARQGKTKEATSYLKVAEKQRFLSGFMLRDMAEVYFHSGDLKKASKLIELAKKGGINVETVDTMIRQGTRRPLEVKAEDMIEQAAAYVRTERYDTARELLHRAAEKEPNEAGIHYWLGRIEAGQENLGEAARQFRMSIQLDRDYAGAYLQLANIAHRRSDHAEALDWLTQYKEHSDALGSYPHYLLGVCHFHLGNLREAEDNFRRAIQRRSDYGAAFYYLARTYLKQERTDSAKQELRLALESRELPRWLERDANCQLARLLSKDGDADEARRHARIAARLGSSEALQLLEQLEGETPGP